MAEASKHISRRQFASATAGIGAMTAAPMIVPSTVLGQEGATPPSDRIIMGGIGLGGRGQGDLSRTLPDSRVQFVAIADIWEERREAVKSTVDQYYKNNDCVMYNDVDELLAREDIEAVLCATSDRWHALMAIRTVQSGKDIYTEKPAAMSIMESYALADNVRRYGGVYQAGCQRRNVPNFELAVGMARSGELGELTAVHANTRSRDIIPPLRHNWWPEEPEPDPAVFDWDAWLGPCPWRPYSSAYPEQGRGQFWDFHAGILEWASHTADICQWAAGADHTQAVEYVPQGTEVHCRYANGVRLVMRDEGWLGLGSCSVRFEGSEGWVETGDSGQIQMSDNLRYAGRSMTMRGTDATLHLRDFLDCIRSRSQPRANAESTCNAHVTSHAAYIAVQLGRKVIWDPAKRAFVNDEEANRMRRRALREPWRYDAICTSLT